MEINIKDLSLSDLHKLEKEIIKEKKNREGILYKSDLDVSKKLSETGLKKHLIDAGVEYVPEEDECSTSICEVWNVINNLKSNIFKICDVTLGNYKLSTSSSRRTLAKTIMCNGSTIGYTVDTKKYEAMVNDICDIVKRYAD